MAEPFVFDPRCTACKSPFGAVACGEPFTLHVRPLACENFNRCILVLHREFAATETEIDLTCDGPEAERVRFSITLNAPAEPELIWYYFYFWKLDGSRYILDRTGYHSAGEPAAWQITVYEKNHTPYWFGDGVTYQIFPDRFCRTELPDVRQMIGNRWVHEDWSDMPSWKPEPDGEVRCRDYYGGSLKGVISKLDELSGLGVSTIYFCPIFEAASNHRYNTADYFKIDPMLGTEEDFKELCAEAKKRGMRVVLDGVFNHTGSQSRYFNADGWYKGEVGAAQSLDSPYAPWFNFHPFPDDYDAWWGIKTLPAVNEMCPSYVDFIAGGQDSVVRHWLKAGASGWRLDVADELPDEFIVELRKAVEETDPDGLLIGEVWEDATTKVAYSRRRKYFLGKELHGVMNYPFRTGIMDYLRGGDADNFREALETLRENYPRDAFYSQMNFLGTHDTPRILTVLGATEVPQDRQVRADGCLSPLERELGLKRVRLAALILFTFPGSPMVYYGDEAGMEGWEDPFNRGGYPWGKEDISLRNYFALLGNLRRQSAVLQRGELHWCFTSGSILAFARELSGSRITTIVNAADEEKDLVLEWKSDTALDLLSDTHFHPENGSLSLHLKPHQGLLLQA